jgi:hypothetical protein
VWQLPSFYCSFLPAPEVIFRVLSTSFFRLSLFKDTFALQPIS